MFTRGTAQACIIVARKSLGLSQRELAKKAGVSQSRVQRIEREGVIDSVPYMEVVAITTALDLSIHAVMDSSFVGRLRKRVPSATPSNVHLTKPAWADQVAAQFALHPTWHELPDTLGRCVRVLARHRPDLRGLGMLIVDHRRHKHTLHYGDRSGSARVVIDIAAEEPGLHEILDALRSTKSFTHSLASNGLPPWCPISEAPCWITYTASAHGMMMMYHDHDPEVLGNRYVLSSALADVMDDGGDLLFSVGRTDLQREVHDLERRLRESEGKVHLLTADAERDRQHNRRHDELTRVDGYAHTNGTNGNHNGAVEYEVA